MKLRRTADLIYDAALALVYPQACAVCSGPVEARADGAACAKCWSRTRLYTGDECVCWKCGAEAGGVIPASRRMEVRCRRCDGEAFTAARACGVYEGALRASILALKREPHIPTRLARLLFEAQQRPPLHLATRIVPVPLHASREDERGFNQAAELARSLNALSGLGLDETSLVRARETERHRAGMDAQARRESVVGAFTVMRPRLIAGESVLLVDDVFTTGATVSASAAALIEAGAEAVYVLTLARPASFG